MGLAAIKPIALELRHNDEVMGRVYAGAVDVANDDILCNADARFWAGLRSIRSRVAFCGPPRPRRSIDLLLVR